MKKLVACAVFLIACGDNGVKPDAFVTPGRDADVDDSGGKDSGVEAVSVDLAGPANALFFDSKSKTLFLTDNDAGALLKYTDANGIQPAGTFPAAAVPVNGFNLGGIVRKADGTVLVTQFGNNTEGALFEVPAGSQTGVALTGPLVARKRIGLDQDSAGTIYVVYTTGQGAAVGGISTVTLDGTGGATETQVATTGNGAALKKMIGVAATPAKVFATNQIDGTHGEVLAYDTTDFSSTQLAATDVVDLISLLPNGDLLLGGKSTLRRVAAADGTITDVDTGSVTFDTVKGTAFDDKSNRVYVIDHSSTAGTPDKLHIIPFTP